MIEICRFYGYSRQAYYKRQKVKARHFLEALFVLDEVRKIRRSQPNVGTRKLHKMIRLRGFKIGRDKLFQILREHHMLIYPKKRYTKTTNSFHRFRKYPNLIKEMKITASDQVFVADITYIDTLEGFCYLFLISDVFSRKIVGYDLSNSLCIEGCQRALKMALKGVKKPEKLIHHSDRGIQYCSNGYVRILEENGIRISMTEENHCYENAIAERINGILKTEFMLGEKLPSIAVAKELVKDSIKTYNEERLHMSLDYQTPEYKYAA